MRPLFLEQQTKGSAEQREAVADEDVIGMANGVILHELGHALVDLYDLPVTGKEEDAVDQLSVLLLTAGDEEHTAYAVSTVNALSGLARAELAGRLPAEAYADEHSLDAQRFYNQVCWLFGSDPGTFASVVQVPENPDGVLPVDRAQGCEAEYDQLNSSWSTLLQPYLKIG
ncbi:DUF4344 domain-containing metallopeptidase [Kitasatospora aburaviensis]|uniref:DUF4344 domain-containing metallopeptidase n=1 Tax=Kitasatospora aburaviensis TaxID=67265 RepID=UPI0031ED174A